MFFKKADHFLKFWVRLSQFSPSLSVTFQTFYPSVYDQVFQDFRFPYEISPTPREFLFSSTCVAFLSHLLLLELIALIIFGEMYKSQGSS